MAFLSPWMLWGLAAVSAPVLIHLWQRRQVVTIHFSTLRFLKAAATRTRRSAILENLLLLLLRCVLFTLLIVAASRPVMPSKLARMLGGTAPRSVVIAVDNSMSMGCLVNGTSRLEAAKKQALALLDDLRDGDLVAVIAAGGENKPLVPKPTLDHKTARKMIEGIGVTEGRSDIASLFREIRKILENETGSSRECYLFTDAQETAWRFEPKGVFDDGWKELSVRTVIVRPDDLSPPNRAVSAVRITSPIASAGSLLSGVAVVDNDSDAPLHDIVEVRIGGDRIAQLPVDVPAHGGTELTFEGRMPGVNGRWAGGAARIQPDNLTPDDGFHFTLPLARNDRVLIVEGQQPAREMLRSGFYLGKALRIGKEGGAATLPETASPQQLDEKELEGYTTVFLADVASLSDRALVHLQRYLHAGGTVVFFPGDLSAVSTLEKLDFLPARPQGVADLPAGRLGTMIADPNHPLVAKIWDKGSPFPALPLRKMMRWKAVPGSRSLMTFSNGEPFVMTASAGAGTVILVNAAADRSWGDFPLSPSFLPLVQQIARLATERGGFQNPLLVGEPVPMTPDLPRDQPLILRQPDGTTVQVPAGEKTTLLDHADQSGVYSVDSAKDGTLQLFAVNAPRTESDLRPLAAERLQQIVPSDMVIGLDGLRQWLGQSRGNIPLWPALLILALLVFTAEGVLSNRLAKTRSQGVEKSIRTGRLNKRRLGASYRPVVGEGVS